jgi:hypothetical protein
MEAVLAFGPGRQKWAVQKGALFKKEKESARRTARCHVSLEKSSKNYIRCESEPSQADIHSLPPPHILANRRVARADFPRGGGNVPVGGAVAPRHGDSPFGGERAGVKASSLL